MTPVQAKKRQKSILSKKKNTRNSKGESIDFNSIGQEERNIIVESRKEQMNLERNKYEYMKTYQSEQLQIEKERLQMEKDSLYMKQEQIMIQTNLEKGKVVLQRMELFKQRQSIKKDYPEVTEEYLNEHFPYPK